MVIITSISFYFNKATQKPCRHKNHLKEARKILGRRGIRYKGMGTWKNIVYLENS